MIPVIDTAGSQQTLDLALPWQAGYRANYVKLGGDNNPRYKASYYNGIVDRSRQIGYRIGHYWVPDDSMDPVGAADFFVNNLRGWTRDDFLVLDNESFSGNDPDGAGPQRDSTLYTDAQAAAWVNRVKQRLSIPGSQVLVYYGLADARGRRHDQVLATGANFIIAAYSYAAFTFATPSNIPADRIVGHQLGGQVFGGVATDINAFKDYAFNYDQGDEMTPQQAEQLQQIFNAIFRGGDSMLDGKKSISQSLAEIHAAIDRDADAIATAVVAQLAADELEVSVDYDRVGSVVRDAVKALRFSAQQ